MRNHPGKWRCLATAPLVALALSAAACGGAAAEPTPPELCGYAVAQQDHPLRDKRRNAGRPRLLLVVVIDQLPSWALTRYLPYLAERGLLRRAVEGGAYFERAEYSFASTLTATGHAAIASGAPPSDSGVPGNSWYDRKRGSMVGCVSDLKHPTFGHPAASASPHALRVDTIGDRLISRSNGASQVISLSLKDRAAVLAGGKRAQLAVWYDARAGGFTTSSYYTKALPAWLESFRASHPPDKLLSVWQPQNTKALEAAGLRDDGPGEGDWLGFGTTFPHDLQRAQAPYQLLKLAPKASEQLITLAGHAAMTLSLGNDKHPDLLLVSISGTDYAGHTFGPDSWEYLDQLMRADAGLAGLFDMLNERVAVDVLITADHGVARLPEASGEGGRLDLSELSRWLRDAPKEAGVPPSAVTHFGYPHVTLAEPVVADAAALAAVMARLSQHPHVQRVFDTRDAAKLRASADGLERAVGNSIVPGRTGDLYYVLAPEWQIDEQRPAAAGTTHGSPWPYDRQVPVLMLGDGVAQLRNAEVVAQSRVASTMAAFLGVPSPPWSGEPLVVPSPSP